MVPKTNKMNITKEEEEAKSQAYIQQLLAAEKQQHDDDLYSLNYYEEYEYEEPKKKSNNRRRKSDSDNDSDYNGTRKTGRKKGKVEPRKSKKPKRSPVSESTDTEVNNENSSKLSNQAKTDTRSTYTQEEEERFLKGIETVGRQWSKLAAIVGTRDSHSVKSHAQKYFIRLYRDGKPLPDKVRETGEGYTLSGKALDPKSSSAKGYLVNRNLKEINKKISIYLSEHIINEKNPVFALEVDDESNEKGNIVTTKKVVKKENTVNKKTPQKSTNITTDTNNDELENKKTNKVSEIKSAKIGKPKINKNDEYKGTRNKTYDVQKYEEDGRTTYSKKRPIRSATRSLTNFLDFMDTRDPLTMVKCESYYGVPGSGTEGCQPFEVIVNPIALATMDLHSHLMKTEIIGLMAGEWNSSEKKLYVKSAFPCKSIGDDNASKGVMNRNVNVELDPVSELEVRNKIAKTNMKVVGWYHSHPKFAPDPSFVDIENQLNYQNLFREENSGIDEPFVGVIVGPYDPRLPRSYSAINWFYVNNNSSDEFGHPRHLLTETTEDEDIPKVEIEKMEDLIDSYKGHPDCHNFTETWKPNLEETRHEKLIKSISYHLGMLKNNENSECVNEENSSSEKTKQDKIEGEVIEEKEKTNSKDECIDEAKSNDENVNGKMNEKKSDSTESMEIDLEEKDEVINTTEKEKKGEEENKETKSITSGSESNKMEEKTISGTSQFKDLSLEENNKKQIEFQILGMIDKKIKNFN